jgi:hypothetical protein
MTTPTTPLDVEAMAKALDGQYGAAGTLCRPAAAMLRRLAAENTRLTCVLHGADETRKAMAAYFHHACDRAEKAEAALAAARVELQRFHAAELPGGWTEELNGQIQARHEAERNLAAARAEAEANRQDAPVAWITRESLARLQRGGNESRGTVPVHVQRSNIATIPLYAARNSRPTTDKS